MDHFYGEYRLEVHFMILRLRNKGRCCLRLETDLYEFGPFFRGRCWLKVHWMILWSRYKYQRFASKNADPHTFGPDFYGLYRLEVHFMSIWLRNMNCDSFRENSYPYGFGPVWLWRILIGGPFNDSMLSIHLPQLLFSTILVHVDLGQCSGPVLHEESWL